MTRRTTFMKWFESILAAIALVVTCAVAPSFAQDEGKPESDVPTPAEVKQAAAMVEDVKRDLDGLINQPRERWAGILAELHSRLERAAEIDPANEKAVDMLDRWVEIQAGMETLYADAVKNRPWPDRFDSFDGPRSRKSLEDAALTFFREHGDYASRKPLSVHVRGNWKPVDRLGELTLQWGLPVWVAFDDDTNDDRATLQEATMLAERHARYGPQRPPFVEAKLLRGVEMARNNVPRHRISTGGFGPLWFLVVIANIAGGIIAAESLVLRYIPAVGTKMRKLHRARTPVGIACLIIGLLAMSWGLLSFSLFSNILPQLSLIAVGLILGREKLLERRQKRLTDRVQLTGASTKGDRTTFEIDEEGEGQSVAEAAAEVDDRISDAAETAADKVRELMIANRARIESMAKYQSRIGVACVFLGLVHAFIGPGVWLF